jgi:predicted lipoprotein with Yx(FWY)xxD motif
VPEENEDVMATDDRTSPNATDSDATPPEPAALTPTGAPAGIPKPRRTRTPAKAVASAAAKAPAKTPAKAPAKAAAKTTTATRRRSPSRPTPAALAAAFAPETVGPIPKPRTGEATPAQVPVTTEVRPDDAALRVTAPENLPPGVPAMRPATPGLPDGTAPTAAPIVAPKAAPAPTRTRKPRSRWARVVTGLIVLAFLGLAVTGLSTAQLPASAVGTSRSGAPSGAPSSAPVAATLVMDGTGSTDGILVNSVGQALYYNEQDTATTPICTGSCARVWVPFTVSDAADLSQGPGVLGQLGTVPRADGSPQVTYNGHLLYTFTVDSVGHATGDGTFDLFDGVGFAWHAATTTGDTLAPNQPGAPTGLPTPTLTPTPTPTPTTTPTPTPSPTPSGANLTRGA